MTAQIMPFPIIPRPACSRPREVSFTPPPAAETFGNTRPPCMQPHPDVRMILEISTLIETLILWGNYKLALAQIERLQAYRPQARNPDVAQAVIVWVRHLASVKAAIFECALSVIDDADKAAEFDRYDNRPDPA